MKIKTLILLGLSSVLTSGALAQNISKTKADIKTATDSILNRRKTEKYGSVNNLGYAPTVYISDREIKKIYLERQNLLIKNAELNDLLDNSANTSLVMPTIYNTIIIEKFRSISGTEIKNGKYFGSSIAVDAKSITANFSWKPFSESEFYLLPTVSGTAKSGFLELFKDNKYSRTVTGGLNFIKLWGNSSSSFSPATRNSLHNDLILLRDQYSSITLKKEYQKWKDLLTAQKGIIMKSGSFIEDYYSKRLSPANPGSAAQIADLEQYKKNNELLIKAKLLPETFASNNTLDQMSIIDKVDPNFIETIVLKSYLDQANELQKKVVFTGQWMQWLSGGIKYNQANYNVVDAASTRLKRSVRDEYVSASLAYTFLYMRSSGKRFYVSPTMNFQNNRNYQEKNLLKLQTFKSYQIGATVLQQIDQEFSLYPSIPDRLKTVYLEVPFAYFNTARSIGYELSIKGGFNDVDNDNLAVRAGILIPVNRGEKNQVIIEPMLKFAKLNEKSDNFLKNKVAFGLNLSVAFPSGIFK